MSDNKEQKTEAALTFIEKLVNLIKKFGVQNIILTIMMLFLVITVCEFAFNPEGIVKKIEQIQTEQHNDAVKKKIESLPQIIENLSDLRYETGADRSFIMETHNGGTNLGNMPFIYVDLTYSDPRATTSWLIDEYKNVRISRYPFAYKVYIENSWVGNLSEIKDIDPELYYRLEKEGAKYLGFMIIHGQCNPSGVIGVAYTESDAKDKIFIEKTLMKYSSRISQLINNN